MIITFLVKRCADDKVQNVIVASTTKSVVSNCYNILKLTICSSGSSMGWILPRVRSSQKQLFPIFSSQQLPAWFKKSMLNVRKCSQMAYVPTIKRRNWEKNWTNSVPLSPCIGEEQFLEQALYQQKRGVITRGTLGLFSISWSLSVIKKWFRQTSLILSNV